MTERTHGRFSLAAPALLVLAGCAGSPPAKNPDPAPVVTTPAPTSDDTETAAAPSSPRPAPTPEVAAIDCKRPEQFGPVYVTPAQYESRYGASAKRFSEVNSDKDHPLEACGVMGSVRALMRLSCDDGSKPFSDPETAHNSRSGNVGPGGRCDSIVDLYRVPCPEKTYEVFIDMYICREGEWM